MLILVSGLIDLNLASLLEKDTQASLIDVSLNKEIREVNLAYLSKFNREVKRSVYTLRYLEGSLVGYQNFYSCGSFSIDTKLKRVHWPYKRSREKELEKLISCNLPFASLMHLASSRLLGIKLLASKMSNRRYEHSLRVAKLAYELAKLHQLEPERYFQAGLFHDATREAKNFTRYEELVERNVSCYFPEGKIPRPLYHQFTAPLYLKKEWGIKDEEVLLAISYHTTGCSNMSLLGKVLFSADKIEPGRKYDSSRLIKAMEDDLEKGFITVLEANREFLSSQPDYSLNQENQLTLSCYKAYLKA